jgi:hypothetical protein
MEVPRAVRDDPDLPTGWQVLLRGGNAAVTNTNIAGRIDSVLRVGLHAHF